MNAKSLNFLQALQEYAVEAAVLLVFGVPLRLQLVGLVLDLAQREVREVLLLELPPGHPALLERQEDLVFLLRPDVAHRLRSLAAPLLEREEVVALAGRLASDGGRALHPAPLAEAVVPLDELDQRPSLLFGPQHLVWCGEVDIRISMLF